MQKDRPGTEAPSLIEARARQIRWLIVGAVVVTIGVLAWLIYREIDASKVSGRWDELEQLARAFEPAQDPLFEDPVAEYRKRRDRYIQALEDFLETKAKTEPDALAPHVHWLIAKTASDQLYSMKDTYALAERTPYYEKAVKHLEALRDSYPDHPMNWSALAPTGYASMTRMFLDKLQQNRAWEEKNLLKPREPDAKHVVLLRTERGDMRIGLYLEASGEVGKRFLERCLSGDYDGTAFFAKAKSSLGPGEPLEETIRGGHPASRGLEPYAMRAHLALTKETPETDPLLPPASRHELPHLRGMVAAWHPPADIYDGHPEFLVAVGRSPSLDYQFTPLGKLLDDASLATADRIFAQTQWREDPIVLRDSGELSGLGDFLQAPVKIVKVLVYEDGVLRSSGEGSETPHKVPAEETEGRLETVVPDAFRKEVPAAPARGAPGGAPAGSPDGEGGAAAPPGDGSSDGSGNGTGDQGTETPGEDDR